jgi:WD40 repeat protein
MKKLAIVLFLVSLSVYAMDHTDPVDTSTADAIHGWWATMALVHIAPEADPSSERYEQAYDSCVALLGKLLCTMKDAVHTRDYPQVSCKKHFRLNKHDHMVTALALDKDVIVTGGEDKRVHVYERISGKKRCKLKESRIAVKAVALTEHTIVVCDLLKVSIYNKTTGACISQLPTDRICNSFVVADEGMIALAGPHNSEVIVYEAFTQAERLRVGEPRGSWITSLALSGDTIVLGKADKTVVTYDKNNGRRMHEFTNFTDSITCVALDGDTLVVCAGSTARVYALGGDCLFTLTGHTKQINAVAITQDFIITGGEDTTVRIYNRSDGQYLGNHVCKHAVCALAAADNVLILGLKYYGEVRAFLVEREPFGETICAIQTLIAQQNQAL